VKVYTSEPMHTAEHILNQTMIRLFGGGRSVSAHIERKKSKCDYVLPEAPNQEQVEALTKRVNEVIAMKLPVTEEWVDIQTAARLADLSRLPEGTESSIRIIRVGDYDTCACSGPHVSNTSEIGVFTVISHDYADGRWRVRWKIN
jgi:misacylated tRNA(Ala) deacylase